MNSKLTSVLLWFFAFVFMAAIAVYQRLTGPTHPFRFKTEINGQEIRGKLLRTSDSPGDQEIGITVPDTAIHGSIDFRRYKSHDEWTTAPMVRKGDKLVAMIPHQPPAGKVMYTITLQQGSAIVKLNEEPVVLRYKGAVPSFILIPHILFMFLAMVFSTRTGLEAIFRRKNTYTLAVWSTGLLLAGGLILGPLVQYHAFGAFWTGWPFGHDLTDNKTAVAFIAWVIAVIRLRKHPQNRWYALAAAIVLLAIYLIPHSVLGSEIDHTQTPAN